MPSRDFTNEDSFSSPMISMHSSTHSSQINTVGPAMSLRTSCWLLPQNVQWSGFLVSPPLNFAHLRTRTRYKSSQPLPHRPIPGHPRSRRRTCAHAPGAEGVGAPPHQLSRKLLSILDRL